MRRRQAAAGQDQTRAGGPGLRGIEPRSPDARSPIRTIGVSFHIGSEGGDTYALARPELSNSEILQGL
ncbi:unnamed protein product [Sphagnum compactum]